MGIIQIILVCIIVSRACFFFFNTAEKKFSVFLDDFFTECEGVISFVQVFFHIS